MNLSCNNFQYVFGRRFECGPMVLRACEVLKHILELQGPLPFMVEVGVDRGEDPRPPRHPETI